MTRKAITLEQVLEVREFFKAGLSDHEAKNYKEAIDHFKKCAAINPSDPKHLDELQRRLAQGGFKLAQESMAYMGCAAVHFNRLLRELGEEDRGSVDIDENLKKVFASWEGGD